MLKPSSMVENIIRTSCRLEAVANKYVFSRCKFSSASIKILGILSRHDSLTPRQIVETIGGTKSNLSQRLAVLEKAGLIRREYAQKADKRTVSVRITPQGRARLKKVLGKLDKAKLSLEENFSAREIREFLAFLEKINSAITRDDEKLKKLLGA